MFRNFLNKNYYSIDGLLNTRALISAKVCYRADLNFLKYRTSLAQSMSNRLVIRGNYLRSYIDLRSFFISHLRANFGRMLPPSLVPYFFKNFDNKKFLLLYLKTKLTCELDYTLHWKANQINSLFNIATLVTKKKKKIQYKQRVFFVKPENRLHFVWKWLNVFVRSTAVNKVPRKYILTNAFENFIHAEREDNVIFDFKLQLYKLYLMKIT